MVRWKVRVLREVILHTHCLGFLLAVISGKDVAVHFWFVIIDECMHEGSGWWMRMCVLGDDEVVGG